MDDDRDFDIRKIFLLFWRRFEMFSNQYDRMSTVFIILKYWVSFIIIVINNFSEYIIQCEIRFQDENMTPIKILYVK